MEPEQILGDKGSMANYQMDNADWGSAFRKWAQISVGGVSKWAVIHNPRYSVPTLSFLLLNVVFEGTRPPLRSLSLVSRRSDPASGCLLELRRCSLSLTTELPVTSPLSTR